jgi:DNA-binding NtrC family response regulator
VYASGRILIFGHNSMLLDTRRRVLQGVGFQVWTATEPENVSSTILTKEIDLLILCQTLTESERSDALRAAHTLRPKMRIVLMCQDVQDAVVTAQDTLVDSFLRPEALISMTIQLTRPMAAAIAAESI